MTDTPHAGASRWFALAALLSANFLIILDLFIVNVSLPRLQTGLGASFSQVHLVIVGYDAALAVLLITGARLGDLYGRRRVFLWGMALFTLSSLICGVAPDPGILIGGRVIQGAAAALLMPQVLASIRVMFDGASRARAFGAMGAVQGVAATISQLAGGFLIEQDYAGLGWRMIFLINLPIGLAAMLAARFCIRETRAPVASRLDVAGALLAASGLFLLLVPIMLGHDHGWPWWSYAGPVAAVPVLAVFVRYERGLSRRGGVPLIEMALFANRRFITGVSAVFLFFSAISSFFLSLTMLLQFGLELSPLAAGAVFTPSAVAFFAASLSGPRLAEWLGRRALLLGVLVFGAGITLSAAGAILDPANLTLVVVALGPNGAGQGLGVPLAVNGVRGCVGAEDAGMGSGISSTMQLTGTTVGVAVVGVVLFAAIGSPDLLDAARAQRYGHALAWATLYNLAAVAASFVLFARLTRGVSKAGAAPAASVEPVGH
ncbi:MFS transporter [Achromobacter sp. Marseille-Q0513]|uniref:MFS transporter n=1 Tax=Achromobacter sp. Marseille-Q0513 TaxID=2829161 RepID=UPI001B96BE95|nr:MFS transporter [Achromobacter sp. Marseille-Q0513]MBR8656817.1 MFS transporter [Achromobacter sp. Marseille-Q0513]